MKLNILNGQVFGNFKVLKELKSKRLPCGQVNRVFKCECVCGNQKDIRLSHLKRCLISSCGCLDNRHRDNNEIDKYIRKIWRAIKYRTSKNYCEKHLYYSKGVRVCEDWKNNYNSFYLWAVENGLKKGLHIDRINGNGNYEPKNCRVVTPTENANNRSNTLFVNYKGKEYAFMDLIRLKNLEDSKSKIRARIKRGWSIEDAIDKK